MCANCKPTHACPSDNKPKFCSFLLLQPEARFGQIIIAPDGQGYLMFFCFPVFI